MDLRVNCECCPIQKTAPVDYASFMVDKYQVGHFHLLKRLAEWVYPEFIFVLWVSRSKMPGDAFIETEFTEHS